MSRRFVPQLVAALTGIVSGIYIFKPLVEKPDDANLKTGSAALGSQPDTITVDNDQSRADDTK